MNWRWIFGLCGCLLFAAVAVGQTPTVEPPLAITFPSRVQVGLNSGPTNATLSVTDETYFLIEAQVECIPLVSPAGAVKISVSKGPITFKGRFAQNPTIIEKRVVDSPYIYEVTPGELKVASAEILMVPVGAKNDSEVQRRTVSLTAPQPPPKPDDPKPVIDNPLPATALRVLMTYDTADTLSAKQNSILRSTKIHAAVENVGGEWRTWSAKEDTSNEGQWWKDAHARAKGKRQPWVIISSPKGFYEGFPDSVEAFIGEIKKLGG